MKHIKLKIRLFFGILFLLYAETVCSQQSFNDFVKDIFNTNKLVINKIDTFFIEKKYKSFIVNIVKHNIQFDVDNSDILKRIYFDKKYVETILVGNDKANSIEMFDIDYKRIKSFNYKNEVYFYLPATIRNATGSFSRICSCLLIHIDSNNNLSAYYFSNQEVGRGFFFRINEADELVYLNIDNSVSSPRLFELYKSYLNEPDAIIYEFSSLVFSKAYKKWILQKDKKGIPYKIIIKLDDQFNSKKIKIIEKYWPTQIKK